jgi:hypothetical protein
MTAPGIHVDHANSLIIGWALVSEIDGEPVFNDHGTHFPADQQLLKAALAFAANGDGMVKLMHDGERAGQIAFIMPVTDEIAKANGFQSRVTGLLVGIRVDPAMLAKFESGELTGLSPAVHGPAEGWEIDDG